MYMIELTRSGCLYFFFFNDTATTEIYTLSLHDALPIWRHADALDQSTENDEEPGEGEQSEEEAPKHLDRKSTRLNSSHLVISYAVFCLKKKKQQIQNNTQNTLQSSDRDSQLTAHNLTIH